VHDVLINGELEPQYKVHIHPI